MLIIPLTGKISKRNPPVITIGIILINCFVFFLLQAGDKDTYQRAWEYYMESGLAEIEMSAYASYQKNREDAESETVSQDDALENDRMEMLFSEMQQDKAFLESLSDDEIITKANPIYTKWKSLRITYEQLLSQTISARFGFKPAKGNPINAFTYMFLHGGMMHLIGNMIFLWLVGCMVELGCGRVIYSMMYVMTGIFSAGLFYLVYIESTVPLVGASGAISGLMGAYTVMYGRRKIKVFYTLGFYFNYAKVTAIVLLPIWIGKEIYELFFGGFSNVAYVAHIGGLISGALLGLIWMQWFGQPKQEFIGQDPNEKIPFLLDQALKRITKLDVEGARPILERILEIDPNNHTALRHLFNIDKLNPKTKEFHNSASKLLISLNNTKDAPETLLETFKEYCRITNHPKLGRDLLFSIASKFSARGYVKESEKIMAALLRFYPGFQKIPTGILQLGRAYLKLGSSIKGRKCLKLICVKYPESSESQIAQRLLREIQ